MQMYARYGVPEQWIVDPPVGTIEVLRLDRGEYTIVVTASGDGAVTSDALPTLRLRAGDVFPA